MFAAVEKAEKAAGSKDVKKGSGEKEGVKIVAAVKGQDAPVLESLLEAGVADFGESYVQEFLSRPDAFFEDGGFENASSQKPRWHFIGQLQSGKVKNLKQKGAGAISLFQSVDRESLLKELAKHFPGSEVLIQMDTTGEPERGGAFVGDVPRLVELAAELGLAPRGIMVIARQKKADALADFRLGKKLQEELGLEIFSAGMSGDFEMALAEGSNMVRLGSALFDA